ncbi:MAG: PorT family protein [Chitinophagaceae bacterium]|nr:PorT family protein [Chitinophagaceae bacterium]
MKKLIILTACIFTAGIVKTNAQVVAKTTGVHLGLRVGANLSNIVQDKSTDFSTGSKIGFNAALFLELPLAPVFSIQPEVQFSQKGYKNTGTYLGNAYEYKQTTNFIEVPLLAKIKPVKNFGILVGPQFSFLASTKTSFSTANASYETLVKEDNNNLRKNILGGVIGIEASAANFVVGLRYNRDFQNNNGDGTSSTPRYKNQVIALNVGLIF